MSWNQPVPYFWAKLRKGGFGRSDTSKTVYDYEKITPLWHQKTLFSCPYGAIFSLSYTVLGDIAFPDLPLRRICPRVPVRLSVDTLVIWYGYLRAPYGSFRVQVMRICTVYPFYSHTNVIEGLIFNTCLQYSFFHIQLANFIYTVLFWFFFFLTAVQVMHDNSYKPRFFPQK